MKILIVTGIYPPDIGGPATYSKLIYEELMRRGIDVEVLSFGTVRHLPNVIRHIVFFFKVFDRGMGADVIYAQDTMSVGWPSFCANLLLRKIFIVRVPGDHVWEQGRQRFGVTESLDDFSKSIHRHHPYLELLKRLRWLVVRYADAVVVPSNYFGGVVRHWSKKVRVITIYNGIESQPKVLTKEEARSKLGFSQPDKIIISVGRLVPWKGFSGLFPVVKSLRDKKISASLVIVGDGPIRKQLENESTSLGLNDIVIFTGAVDREQLFRYLSAADVFVLNTQFESFSFQTVEAMAAGVPVVVTRVGSLPELVTDGVGGVLVSPDDTDGIAQAIEKIVSDVSYRASLVLGAKKKASQFSIERTTDEFMKLVSSFDI